MKSKTRQLIARIIVGLLVFFMILSIVAPYIFAAEKFVSYSNEDLHMSFKIPSSAKNDMEKISENAREFSVNFNLTVRVSYGDIYEEVLKSNKLSKKELLRKQVYIESNFVKDTWNNEDYIKDYFKDILDDAKSSYDYKISKTTISGIPAWRCSYEGKSVKSEGEYYLTVNNGGLYTLQIDSYMADMSENKSTINKIIDSYEITDVYIPTQTELTTVTKQEEKTTVSNAQNNQNTQAQNQENNNDETSVIFSYFVGGIILLAIFISLGVYIVKQKKYKKRKKERKNIRVKRRNNEKL
ncbi:hypothetical protein [Anaerofustis butyriciformans]|uniref:hypothetical protein n=1 Tax=Anaerofustis butyriciformans TaxID=3108533 RepID=UPI003F8897C6